MNKIKFTLTFALLMAIILVIGEYNASIYGNALYVGYKDVMFGTKIGRLVGVGLADKENSFFVTQDVDFKTKEGSSLLVNKFCGYGVDRDSLFVLIDAGRDDFVSMGFGSEKEVEDRNPEVWYDKRTDVSWVEVVNTPFYVYYWRLIAFLLSFTIVCSCLVLVFNASRMLLRKKQ